MSAPSVHNVPPDHAFRCEFADLPLAEFDIGGVLYHANYYRLYERAREALLRHIEAPYPDLVRESRHLTLVEGHQSFLKPITYGQVVVLFLWVSTLGRTSAVFEYLIQGAADADPVHRGWTRVAFVEVTADGFATRRLPEGLRQGLARFQNP